ncbi:DUF4351 domain-containing protein [Clostridioides difficile]
MFNSDLYEEGVEVGIERGQHLLLMQLLTKKLGRISEKYLYKLEDLESNQIINIALDIFNIKTIEDLDKYFI